ncbi:MAG: hypothetical protein JWR16_269 [Nevskia sp.]|nr:hypothetical protein [Nevskia sp.]
MSPALQGKHEKNSKHYSFCCCGSYRWFLREAAPATDCAWLHLRKRSSARQTSVPMLRQAAQCDRVPVPVGVALGESVIQSQAAVRDALSKPLRRIPPPRHGSGIRFCTRCVADPADCRRGSPGSLQRHRSGPARGAAASGSVAQTEVDPTDSAPSSSTPERPARWTNRNKERARAPSVQYPAIDLCA